MQLFLEFCLSLNFELHLLGLKTFQGSSMYGKHQKDKEYRGCSKFSPITLNKPVTIEPLSTYIIKHQCPHENSCYTEGTTYKPSKTAKVKRLIYYHTMVSVNESYFPSLTANQNPTPVTLQKGLLGHTFTPILGKGKGNQLFLINKPLQVAEFFNENCHFLDVEEIFEISIEDKRIIERNSDNCQEAGKKTFTHSNLDTDFPEELKGSCLPKCNEKFPIHRRSALPQILHHHFSEEVSFLSFFDFKYSDLTDAELTSPCQILIKDKDVYSRHKYGVGCTKQKLHINLKDDAFFKPQRVTKLPMHYREQVNALLERLIQVGIIRRINNDDELGTFLDNPIIYLRKEKNLKLCVDSRFLTSITKLVSMPFAIEPIHILLTRLTGKIFFVSDLSNAHHQVPLNEESQKCTAFVIGNKQYIYCRGFHGLSGLPNFFSRLMTLSMAPLIIKKSSFDLY